MTLLPENLGATLADAVTFHGKAASRGRLVLSLLAEKIGDGGWVFIQVNSLGPAAVDVIHHALERPQACESSEAVIVGECPALRGVQDGVHRRDARVPLTLFEQFALIRP